MFKDFFSSWDIRLRDELLERGYLALVVSCFSEPLGTWFNWGARAPGDLIARTADRLTDLHRESGDERPLIIDGVAFSSGCEALLHAAKEMESARFHRLIFLHSSSFAFSGEIDRLIEQGRVQDVRNYWSPLDLMTLFAPLGAGMFSLASDSSQVKNIQDWMPHVPHLIDGDARARIIGDLQWGRPRPHPGERESETTRRLRAELENLARRTR